VGVQKGGAEQQAEVMQRVASPAVKEGEMNRPGLVSRCLIQEGAHSVGVACVGGGGTQVETSK